MHPPQASLVCPLTKKRFKTRAAYENHVRSKKYAALLAKSTGEAQGDAPASAGAAGGTAAVGASAEPEALPAAPVVAAVVAAAPVPGCSAAGCSSSEGGRAEAPGEAAAGAAGEESDGWVDEEEEPWVARWGESLFDTHVRCRGDVGEI